MRLIEYAALCILGAAACFHFSDRAFPEAERLKARGGDTMDKVFQMGRHHPVVRVTPSGVQEENPWVVRPSEAVKKPENKPLVQQAETDFNTSEFLKSTASPLRLCGYGLLGLALLLLLARAVADYLAAPRAAPAKEVEDAAPPV